MIGLDLLGLGSRHWPVKDSIHMTPDGFAIGCFLNTFGNAIPNLKKHLDSGKFPAVRIHAHWSNSHAIIPKNDLKKAAVIVNKLARQYPAVKVYLSHSCEYDEPSREKVKERVDIIRQLAPDCIPVNSVMRGATMPDVITEHHGASVKAKRDEIVSTDGINIYDIDAEKWVRENGQAIIAFLWGLRFNLRENTKPGQTVIPPKLRQAAPSKEYLKAVIRLANHPGIAPQLDFPGQVRPIRQPDLFKPFAEDSQGQSDMRENRPVFIVKSPEREIHILTKDAAVIGRLIYGGSFGDNQSRFYAGLPGGIRLYGAGIDEKAKRLSGSEFVWLKSGRIVYGPVNPAFRAGFFR